MAFTNSWDESTPAGSDAANTTDDFFRKHRLDLGERLEGMLYGFNSSDNSNEEGIIGIKNLKMFEQSADPSTVSNYGHLYTKEIGGVAELFFQGDDGNSNQITSGGNLKSTGELIVDGISTLTGTVTMGAGLSVGGNINPASYITGNGGFLDSDSMTGVAGNTVASSESIKAYIDNGDAFTDISSVSSEATAKMVFPGGMIWGWRIIIGIVGGGTSVINANTTFGMSVVFNVMVCIRGTSGTSFDAPKASISGTNITITNTDSSSVDVYVQLIGR